MHQDMDCLNHHDLHTIRRTGSGRIECKQWCEDNDQCAGFTVVGNNCYFKNLTCYDNLFSYAGRNVYLKK